MLAFAQYKQCQIRESMELCAWGWSHAANFEWLSTCHLNALGFHPHDFNVSWLHVGAAAAAAPAPGQGWESLPTPPEEPHGANGPCCEHACFQNEGAILGLQPESSSSSLRAAQVTGWWHETQFGRARACWKAPGEFRVETWFHLYALLIR